MLFEIYVHYISNYKEKEQSYTIFGKIATNDFCEKVFKAENVTVIDVCDGFTGEVLITYEKGVDNICTFIN